MQKQWIVSIVLFLTIIALTTFGYFKNIEFQKQLIDFKNKITTLKQNITTQLATINQLEKENKDLKETLGIKAEELEDTQNKTEQLQKDVKTITKIINTDEELLKLYSKVSFLNEHYIPSKLSYLEDSDVLGDKPIQIHKEVLNHLEEMIKDASDDDIDIKIVSGYRSFGEQASLKYNYTVQYGSGANTFSADQGYSEHQLGTTIDISNKFFGPSLTTSFDQTQTYNWLTENAYKYGFVLSYPKGNTYYQYEPWHWRFVSVDLATDLHKSGKTFYGLDQRDTFKYLANFFD
jgi:zinc D-Ala-D-Ala carboxypeptidase